MKYYALSKTRTLCLLPLSICQSERAASGSGEKWAVDKSEHSNPDDNADKEWLKDYLSRVYGVSISGPRSLQQDLSDSGYSAAARIIAEDFVFRLLARFNDLDLAPCDGFISVAEIEFALNNPRYYFDQEDAHMLRIFKHYYHLILDLAAQESGEAARNRGVSRQDLEIIGCSQNEQIVKLRRKLEEVFAAKERV